MPDQSNLPSTELATVSRPLMETTVAEAPPQAGSMVDKFLVVFAQPEIGAKKYYVPNGATVQDLLQVANANVHNMDLMIGREKVTPTHVLQRNTVLFAVPRPKNA